jgi:hypothetical protein
VVLANERRAEADAAVPEEGGKRDVADRAGVSVTKCGDSPDFGRIVRGPSAGYAHCRVSDSTPYPSHELADPGGTRTHRVVCDPLDAERALGIRVEEDAETSWLGVSEHGMWGCPSSTSRFPGAMERSRTPTSATTWGPPPERRRSRRSGRRADPSAAGGGGGAAQASSDGNAERMPQLYFSQPVG